jgi:hypothetical protein
LRYVIGLLDCTVPSRPHMLQSLTKLVLICEFGPTLRVSTDLFSIQSLQEVILRNVYFGGTFKPGISHVTKLTVVWFPKGIEDVDWLVGLNWKAFLDTFPGLKYLYVRWQDYFKGLVTMYGQGPPTPDTTYTLFNLQDLRKHAGTLTSLCLHTFHLVEETHTDIASIEVKLGLDLTCDLSKDMVLFGLKDNRSRQDLTGQQGCFDIRNEAHPHSAIPPLPPFEYLQYLASVFGAEVAAWYQRSLGGHGTGSDH